MEALIVTLPQEKFGRLALIKRYYEVKTKSQLRTVVSNMIRLEARLELEGSKRYE